MGYAIFFVLVMLIFIQVFIFPECLAFDGTVCVYFGGRGWGGIMIDSWVPFAIESGFVFVPWKDVGTRRPSL